MSRIIAFQLAPNVNQVQVIQAVKRANDLINDSRLYNEIKDRESYYMSSCNGEKISELLQKFVATHVMTVNIYKSKNPFTKAIGMFMPNKPHDIFLNIKFINRSVSSIVATLIHELIHAVDAFAQEDSFGHGDNKYTIEKEGTAPYYIDFLAENIIAPDITTETMINQRIVIKYYTWYKPWTWF